MLMKIRSGLRATAMVTLEVAGLAASSCGAAITLFFGKLFAAAILGVLALGIFLRLTGRRRPPPADAPVTSPWLQLACALLSLLEVAGLAEASNLPVRFNQPDFEKSNWLLVVVALLVIYFIQLRFLRSVLKRNAATLPHRP